MSSRARKKKLRNALKKNLDVGSLQPEYSYFQSPFSDIPFEERIRIIKEVIKKINEETLPSALKELKSIIVKHDPINMLCLLSYYFLTKPQGDYNKKLSEMSLEQYQIELLQAYVLHLNTDEYEEFQPFTLYNSESMIKVLKDITESFNFKLFKDNLDLVSDEERKLALILHSLRIHTIAVRNWAYPKETFDTLFEIFSPINDKIKKDSGIDLITIIEFFQKLANDIEVAFNNHRNKILDIFRSKDKSQIIRKYIEYFEIENTFEDLLDFSKKFRSRDDFRHSLRSHSDMFLTESYLIDKTKYIDEYLGKCPNLGEIISDLTMRIGDLAKENSDYFYMANPIWNRPFFEGFDEKIYYPIPSLFQHTNFQVIEYLLSKHPNSLELISKRRATYLEDEIEKTFLNSFPTARVYKNLEWIETSENISYENDVLVLLDTSAIIIEAKSAKFSEPAKRGAPLRLKDEIKTFLIEPAEQTYRFMQFIFNNRASILNLKNKNSDNIELDLSKISRVIRLCVTLEFVPVISSSKNDLFDAGLIDNKNFIPTTMSLNDLKIIFEILVHPSIIIHYLYRRAEIEENANVDGDELDLLTFYLETGFNIGESEFNGEGLILTGNSQKLDNYFIDKYYDNKNIKPTSRRTKWWNDTIAKMEERKIPGWSELAYIYQNVSYEDQVKIEGLIKRQSQTVNNKWGTKDLKNSIVLISGPPQRKDMIIWFIYKSLPIKERNEKVSNVVASAFDEYKLSQALVIGLNIEKNQYPYSFMALLKSDEKNIDLISSSESK